ncbi:hypothetical protein CR513_08337, partial [Mucuna pruriens]
MEFGVHIKLKINVDSILVCLYVDNLFVIGSDHLVIEEFKERMKCWRYCKYLFRLRGCKYLNISLGDGEYHILSTILKRHKKLSHIEGSGPPRDDTKFEVWDDENSLIMTWLWNSMTLEISWNYMFYSSIRKIWENLIKIYLMKKDSIVCYDIESKIFNSRQGTLSVTKNYGGRIFKFLHGLNSKYNPIRIQILGKEKLPSLSEAFFIVRNEET